MTQGEWQLTKWLVWITLAVVYCAAVEVCHAEEGVSSWYSTECCRYNHDPACPTASGRSLYALEGANTPFAASWAYPLGTHLQVCLKSTPTRCTEVIVLDRGPNKRLHRLIDLSKQAYRELADLRTGTIQVIVRRTKE